MIEKIPLRPEPRSSLKQALMAAVAAFSGMTAPAEASVPSGRDHLVMAQVHQMEDHNQGLAQAVVDQRYVDDAIAVSEKSGAELRAFIREKLKVFESLVSELYGTNSVSSFGEAAREFETWLESRIQDLHPLRKKYETRDRSDYSLRMMRVAWEGLVASQYENDQSLRDLFVKNIQPILRKLERAQEFKK